MFSDLEPTTFQKFLKQLLSKQDFNLHKEIQGTPLSPPSWEYCMSYEFELRKEAYKQCRETNIGIKAAWWNAYNNQQHRMMHWLQLVSLLGPRARRRRSSLMSRGSLQTSGTKFVNVPAHPCRRARAKEQQQEPSQTEDSLLSPPLRKEAHAQRRGAKRRAPKGKARATRPQPKCQPEEWSGSCRTCSKIHVSGLFSQKSKTARFVLLLKSISVTRSSARVSMSALVAGVQSHTTSAFACSRGSMHSSQHELPLQPLRFRGRVLRPSSVCHQ